MSELERGREIGRAKSIIKSQCESERESVPAAAVPEPYNGRERREKGEGRREKEEGRRENASAGRESGRVYSRIVA